MPEDTNYLIEALSRLHPQMAGPAKRAIKELDLVRIALKGSTTGQIIEVLMKAVPEDQQNGTAGAALAKAFKQSGNENWTALAMGLQAVRVADFAWQTESVDNDKLPAEVIRHGLLVMAPEQRAEALKLMSEEFRAKIETALKAEDEAVAVLMTNPRNVVGAAKAISAIIRGPQAIELVKGPLMEEAARRIAAAEAQAKAKETAAAEPAADVVQEETPAPADPPTVEQIAKRIEEALTSVSSQVRKLIVEGKTSEAAKVIADALTGIVADPKAEAEGRVVQELHAMIREKAADNHFQSALANQDLAAMTLFLMEVGLYPQGDSFTAEEIKSWLETADAGITKAEAPDPAQPVVKIVKTDPAPAKPAAQVDKVEAVAEEPESEEDDDDPRAKREAELRDPALSLKKLARKIAASHGIAVPATLPKDGPEVQAVKDSLVEAILAKEFGSPEMAEESVEPKASVSESVPEQVVEAEVEEVPVQEPAGFQGEVEAAPAAAKVEVVAEPEDIEDKLAKLGPKQRARVLARLGRGNGNQQHHPPVAEQ